MSITGFGPAGQPKYHPERDYAYITGSLLKAAIENLHADAQVPSEIADWCRDNNVTDEELTLAVAGLADAQFEFVKAYDPVKTLDEALARYGFEKLRLPVRMLLFSEIGRVMVAAWFHAVREVSNVGMESPAQGDMARFATAARLFCQKHGAPSFDANTILDRLRFENDTLRTQIAELTRRGCDSMCGS
jgi:hypothetical protein